MTDTVSLHATLAAKAITGDSDNPCRLLEAAAGTNVRETITAVDLWVADHFCKEQAKLWETSVRAPSDG